LRESVNVFVGIDVSKAQAARLKETDLSGYFCFDFCGVDATGEEAVNERRHFDSEMSGGGFDKRWDLLGRENWRAADQNNMTADAEGRRGQRYMDRVLGCGGTNHQRRAGNDTGPVKLDNGAIDAGGEAEVVSVDDETGHLKSVAT
jgi:hypothetical protein